VPAFHDFGAVATVLCRIVREVDGRPAFSGAIVLRLEVERPRQDTRCCGFADAAHAGQHVSLRDPPLVERVLQGSHHRVLPDQVGERLRPVFAREDDVRLPRPRLRVIEHAVTHGPGLYSPTRL